MRLKTLKLHNFRKFEELEIEFHQNLTVLIGANGAGKTTVLDAAAVSIGSLFTGLNGVAGPSIKAKDARVKAFPMGAMKMFNLNIQFAFMQQVLKTTKMENENAHCQVKRTK